jgi:hypothetical protein
MNKELNSELRQESGVVKYSDTLTDFLYELLRDHVTPGDVQIILAHALEDKKHNPVVYSNGWLAEYAHYVAEKINNE